MKYWVIVAEVCGNCGGRQAVRVLDHKPSVVEENEVREALGGAFCIGLHTYETEDGEIVTWRSDDCCAARSSTRRKGARINT